jgi:hypothetical protein
MGGSKYFLIESKTFEFSVDCRGGEAGHSLCEFTKGDGIH